MKRDIFAGNFLNFVDMSNKRFYEVAALWKESKRDVVKYSTYCAYTLILKTHLLPSFGDAEMITEDDAQQFVFDRLRDGLSRKTVQDMMAVLKSVAKFGAKHGIFRFEPWDVVYPTETASRQLPVLSRTHHRKLLRELSEHPTTQNIGVMLALCTGLRIGEVCALRWEQVDMTHRVISVRGTVGRIYNCETSVTERYVSTPKTRTSNRDIPVSPILLNALRSVRTQQQQCGSCYVVGDGAHPKEPRSYRDVFVRLLKRLGIPQIVFHGLRHTFATRCIEEQCDYKTVSVILGHSSVSTTMNLYVHPNLDQKRRCMARLDRFMNV